MDKTKNFLKTLNSCYLCIKYPFLYPRNRFNDKHYNWWRFTDFSQKLYNKSIKICEDKVTIKVTNYFMYFLYKITIYLHNFIRIFHFIPTFTELDSMPKGWRTVFGLKMCKEIKQSLLKIGDKKLLHKYRITQIKEKFGVLRWYDYCSTKEIQKIITKYEIISKRTCIVCGNLTIYFTNSCIWASPYCDQHIEDYDISNASKYILLNPKEIKKYNENTNSF